ncbi:MAG: AsmA family protein [Rickettsiales bacterium]|jgi:hypothetical protein|nr:AsmA family protein [Rickettsiales bacterium]
MMYKRRFFFKAARIFAMFIIGLIVAVFIALSQVNLETLRNDLVAVMRDSTGLPVEIDGGISWKFSLRPKVELNDIRIPNAEWAENKNFLTAKKVRVTLNLLSLLRAKPTVQNVSVYNADIFIEKNERGEYSISRKLDEKADKKAPADTHGKYPFNFDIGLASIEAHNLTANILNSKYSLAGLQVNYNSGRNSEEYTGWLKSDLKVYPFIVSFSEFNSERKVYPVRVALSTGGQALVFNIALEGTSKLPIDFIISGGVPDVSLLGKIFDVRLPKIPLMNLNLAGGFAHKKISLRKSSVMIRNSDLAFSGSIDWSGKIPAIDANIKSHKLNLYEVFPELYNPSSKWVRPNRELNVFKDIPLYGQEFLKYNLSLAADIGDLIVYRELAVKNINIRANLKNANARLDAKVKFAEGDIKAAAEVSINPEGRLDVRAAGIGERIYVGEIMKDIRENDYMSELPSNFEFYAEAGGLNLSELMSTITGPVYVYSVAPGYAHSKLVAYVYGTDFLTDLRHDIQDLFRTKKKYNQITVSCAAVNLKLRNGVISTENGVALESNAINLRAVGDIDFGKERLKASLITVPSRGLKLSITGNVVNSMEFSGNLAEPDIKINGSAVAGKVASATGIGLLLAPFTGGIGLVAGAGVGLLAGDLLENWLADDHPCRTAINHGLAGKKGDPDWLNQPMAELVTRLVK